MKSLTLLFFTRSALLGFCIVSIGAAALIPDRQQPSIPVRDNDGPTNTEIKDPFFELRSNEVSKRGIGPLAPFVRKLPKVVKGVAEVVDDTTNIINDVKETVDKFKEGSLNQTSVAKKKTRKCRVRKDKVKECQCGPSKDVYEVLKAVCHNGRVYNRHVETTTADRPKVGVAAGKYPPALEKYRSSIQSASEKTGVPAKILAAQIWAESRGDPGARSTNPVHGTTDGGLMQINSDTFADLQSRHPELQGREVFDPETNILAGAFYMSEMSKQFNNDWRAALRAFNSGPDDVDPDDLSKCKAGDPKYVENVMSYAKAIEEGGDLPD